MSLTRQNILKGFKYTIASLIAIIIAEEFKLNYGTTAGIISILSIQNTKLDTLKMAARRGIAFLCAIFISFVCYSFFGYNAAAFGVYLLIFSAICFSLGWVEAISMSSVAVTHFLTEESMSFDIVRNEIYLFIIGASMGIIANSHLRQKGDEFNLLVNKADEKIKETLREMSYWLLKEDKSEYINYFFEELENIIQKAKNKAYENKNNSYFYSSDKETDYIEMRKHQIVVLNHMYKSIKMLKTVPIQAKEVSKIISKVEHSYARENHVIESLAELKRAFNTMQKEPLPVSREEFEERAVLYFIMKQLEELLMYKENYMERKEDIG